MKLWFLWIRSKIYFKKKITLHIRFSNFVKGEYLEGRWIIVMKQVHNPVFRLAQEEEFEQNIHYTIKDGHNQYHHQDHLSGTSMRTNLYIFILLLMIFLVGPMTRDLNWSNRELRSATSGLLSRTLQIADHILGLDWENMLAIVVMMWCASLNADCQQKELAPSILFLSKCSLKMLVMLVFPIPRCPLNR